MAHATSHSSRTGRPEPPAAPRAPAPWLGAVALVAVGTAWHFVYAASGDSPVVGLVAPINESVWEHTKLIAIPMLMWAALVGWRTRALPAALRAGVAGGSAGIVLMVLGYYGYVAVLGSGWFPMDLVLFVLCALAALSMFERVRVLPAGTPLAVALVALELAALAALTVAPPDWPLFVPGAR